MDQPQGPHSAPRIRILMRPQGGLLGRILYFVIGLLVLVAAFFFIGIVLIAGTVIAAVLLLRWWWIRRKLPRRPPADDGAGGVVEGEYTVIESASTDQRLPPVQATRHTNP